jgi:hypothetical protein
MKKLVFYLLALSLVLLNACQKELSNESGNTPSEGSLQSDVSGDCLPKTVNGTYTAGTSLAATINTIDVQVNVSSTGSYTVYTDTVNGYYFSATGIFTSLGTTTVTLRGGGTPFTEGINNFVVNYDSTFCGIAVTVLSAGSGGPAAFSLQNTSGTCTATVNGSYAPGVVLNNNTNTVTLSVNVASIGTYNISTTLTNGMTFSATGSFTTTGVQTVTLKGSGTPATTGSNIIPVTAGTSSCSFTVTVGSGAVGTLGGTPGVCTPAVIAGTVMLGTPLTNVNTVQIQATVATAGAYNIKSDTVSGFSFAGSGNFSATGVQNVILIGSGTPTVSGPVNFTVKFGTSTCTFMVTVAAVDYFPRTTNSNWSYEINDVSTDSFYRKVIAPTHSAAGNTYNIFMFNDGSGLDSSGYYRKSGTDYFEYFDVGGFFTFDNPSWVEYTFLKEVAAGTVWKSAGFTGTYTIAPNPPQSVTVRFSYKILQKDVAVSITTSTGTVSYPNTIVVEEKYEQEISPGNWVDATPVVGYGKSYYARGVGLIKYEAFDPAGAPAGQQELRRYQVF